MKKLLKPSELLPQDEALEEKLARLGDAHNNSYFQFQQFSAQMWARFNTLFNTFMEICPEFGATYKKYWFAGQLSSVVYACEAARVGGDLSAYSKLHKEHGRLRDLAVQNGWLDLYNKTIAETHENIRQGGNGKAAQQLQDMEGLKEV